MLKGIDISVWQGRIDWSEVAKDENVKFAILRAGYGKHVSQKDTRFEEYYAGCKRYNIPVGAYWFSYATTKQEAIQEAKACIECIKGKQFEYPILFDIEHSSQASKAIADVIIPAFCDTLKEAGYYVGIYTYYSFIKSYISKSVYSKYDLALAHYASSTPWSDKEIWQFSSKGSIMGINGGVDLDYCYVDNYPEKIKSLGLNNLGSGSSITEETKPETPKEYMVSIDKPAPANKVTTFSSTDKTQISKHFNVQEFKCKCGKQHDILINLYLVYMLEKIMDTMKCSMTIINSGYRCPDYDKKIGGFVGQHGVGNAVDAVFYDQKKKVIDTRLISCVAQDLGLGGIANINKTYTAIHLDARTSNIWKGNEIVSNSTVTDDFYKYYGLTKDDVYKNMMVPVKPVTPPPTTPTTPTTPSTTIKAGQKVILKNTTLYASASAKSGSSKSGTYYVYNTEVVSNRIRITNAVSNVGKTPMGTYVSGWVDVSVVTRNTSSSTSPTTSLKAGTKVTLKSVELYASSTASKCSSKKSGTYYIYSDETSNGRIRITNSVSNVGKAPAGTYVSGWIKTSDLK